MRELPLPVPIIDLLENIFYISSFYITFTGASFLMVLGFAVVTTTVGTTVAVSFAETAVQDA